MNYMQQSGYYYYRKSTILFFTNNGETEYNNFIMKQQYLAWLDLPLDQRQIFDSVALFCQKNSIHLYDKKTKRPQKPPTPLFLYFRVVEDRLKKENPQLQQSQIFKIAEQRWKNDLIQRIKDQFTKIHQILDLSYIYENMQYKKKMLGQIDNNKNDKINFEISQKYAVSSPGIKFSSLTKSSILNQQKYNSIISQINHDFDNSMNSNSEEDEDIIF